MLLFLVSHGLLVLTARSWEAILASEFLAPDDAGRLLSRHYKNPLVPVIAASKGENHNRKGIYIMTCHPYYGMQKRLAMNMKTAHYAVGGPTAAGAGA